MIADWSLPIGGGIVVVVGVYLLWRSRRVQRLRAEREAKERELNLD